MNFYAIKAVSRKAADRQKILAKYFVSERKLCWRLKILLFLDKSNRLKMIYFAFPYRVD